MKIDGMMCSMCEAHICETIRKAVPAAKKVSASKGKKEASFLTEQPVEPDDLKAAIDATRGCHNPERAGNRSRPTYSCRREFPSAR